MSAVAISDYIRMLIIICYMNKVKVVVFGVGKLAEYLCYVLNNDSRYEVSALCIQKAYMPETNTLWGLNVVDFDLLTDLYPCEEYKLFIAVGNNDLRERLYKETKMQGYSFVSYLSSRAIVWDDLVYGENVMISEGTVIQPFVSIGNNALIFGAKVGHHCTIGNNTILSACYLGGSADIGDNSFLGINSTVNQNIKIGKSNIIGVGSNICTHTDDFDVFTNKGTVKRTLSAQFVKNKYLS